MSGGFKASEQAIRSPRLCPGESGFRSDASSSLSFTIVFLKAVLGEMANDLLLRVKFEVATIERVPSRFSDREKIARG